MKWHKFPDEVPPICSLLLLSWVAALSYDQLFYRYELGYYYKQFFFGEDNGGRYEILRPNKDQIVY